MMTVKDMHFRHLPAGDEVLRGITFDAEPGKLTAILGPNGSGKTTLFKCIAGLWHAQRGDILFGGTSIRSYRHSKRAKVIAAVPQEHEPPFPYSVYDAVMVGRTAHAGMFSGPSRHDRLKAEEAIDHVGITHLKNRPYTMISGGERQLVLVARALAQEAPVILLDEPTSHLDFRNQILILKKLKEIVGRKSVTGLMTIHDPNLAQLFSDSVVIMNNGTVVSQGPPHEIINEENLTLIYQIEVSVLAVNGSRVVMPRLAGL